MTTELRDKDGAAVPVAYTNSWREGNGIQVQWTLVNGQIFSAWLDRSIYDALIASLPKTEP